ncbi:MAG TPA: pilus assembly protein N-terminal domain-containing protein [Terracidiphilus sp.]|jgi:pilus assembly protein CpaC
MKSHTFFSGSLTPNLSRALFVALSVTLAIPAAPAHAAKAKSTLQGGTAARQDATNELALVVGRSVLLDTAQSVQRVAVGLGDFAEASVISPNEIMVNGKAAGETTLILWESGGNREFFNVVVRPSSAAASDRLEGIRREIRTELPGQTVKITQENGSVFLRGNVDSLTSSDRAVAIASAGLAEKGAKVVNLLNVNVPASKAQILLKCNFASLDRSKSKELGINFFSTGFGNVIGGASTGQFSPPSVTWQPNASGSGLTTTAALSNELNLFAFFPGLDLGATIRALEDKGLVQVLSEPNVLAEDGKQGSILAGGSYPYPVVQGSASGGNTVTIQFKEYGIRLIFLPHVTARGTIDLQIISEVSSLDFSNAVTISGFTVPGLAERRVQTSVELAKGQSFAIGGLLDNRTTETLQKIPYISNIPILGKFFQSISKTKNNSELIVIVTPELVQPAPEGTVPLPNFTEPFLPPHSTTPMHHPDGSGDTAAHAAVPPPVTIPVEQLIQNLKDQPLVTDSTGAYSGSGYGTTGASTAGAATPNASQAQAPQQ